MKSCYVCLKSDNNAGIIINGSFYKDIFIQLMGVKDISQLWLCMWCVTVLRKALELKKLFIETQEMLKFNKQLPLPGQLFKFSYHHSSITISPTLTEEIASAVKTTDTPSVDQVCMKTILHKNEDIEIDPLKANDVSLKAKIRRTKLSRENLKIMGFNIKYLSKSEQLVDLKSYKRYKEIRFQCEYCYKGFVCMDAYEDHSKRHSLEAGPHSCRICKLRFKSSDVLRQHTLAHKRRFSCLLCEASFKRWAHCIGHRYKCQSSNVAVSCQICQKVFSNEHCLRTHELVHKRKKHVCRECGKELASKQRLHIHTRSHTGHKPFKCTICSKQFTTNSNLRSHAAVHTDTRLYHCVECDTHYKTSKGLRRHFLESLKHQIPGVFIHKCSECPKSFPSAKTLDGHTRSRHRTTHQCLKCHKNFANGANLKKHTKCVHSEFK